MPELPEVEFARNCLRRWLEGDRLARIDAKPSRVLRGSSPRALKALVGHRIDAVERWGKQLFVRFDDGLGLLAHLGMTGKFVFTAKGAPPPRWPRASFTRASDGAVIHYSDPRMFGRLIPGATSDLEKRSELASLGPDAYDHPPSIAALATALARTGRTIKEALMDQTILAGIGNIQATEALFRARIYPARPARSLDRAELGRVLRAIRWTLDRTFALSAGEDTITYIEEANSMNPFIVYDREGEPCPRCRTALVKTVIGGRGSTYCRECQG